jgi:hypothetical protein
VEVHCTTCEGSMSGWYPIVGSGTVVAADTLIFNSVTYQ